MQKLIRSFAVVAMFSVSASSAMMAEPMGTNPRPYVVVAAPHPTLLEVIQYTVLSYLGL